MRSPEKWNGIMGYSSSGAARRIRQDDVSSDLSEEDYRQVAEFRSALIRFQQLSESLLDRFSISIRQYQALLLIRTQASENGLPVGELATQLMIRPSSATGMVSRLEAAGLIQRDIDINNRRSILLTLTPRGESILQEIAAEDRESIEDIRSAVHKFFGNKFFR